MKPAKAVFLDRDGVINKDNKSYTFRIADFQFNAGVFESLKILSERNYQLIVITNQAGIAKGLYSHTDVEQVHAYMKAELLKHNIPILEVYYCPHFPEFSSCLCRKPGSLLIEKAIARFSIDPSRSVFVGDRQRDMDAARHAGIKGIRVDENQDLRTILHLIP